LQGFGTEMDQFKMHMIKSSILSTLDNIEKELGKIPKSPHDIESFYDRFFFSKRIKKYSKHLPANYLLTVYSALKGQFQTDLSEVQTDIDLYFKFASQLRTLLDKDDRYAKPESFENKKFKSLTIILGTLCFQTLPVKLNVTSRTFMDIYILLKIFKQYSGPQNNIIIYAGEKHIETYKILLTYFFDFKVDEFTAPHDKEFCVTLK
jgi:hypothetical protein